MWLVLLTNASQYAFTGGCAALDRHVLSWRATIILPNSAHPGAPAVREGRSSAIHHVWNPAASARLPGRGLASDGKRVFRPFRPVRRAKLLRSLRLHHHRRAQRSLSVRGFPLLGESIAALAAALLCRLPGHSRRRRVLAEGSGRLPANLAAWRRRELRRAPEPPGISAAIRPAAFPIGAAFLVGRARDRDVSAPVDRH